MQKSPRERYSRPPWQRMMKIHDAIQSGRRPNGVELAAELEVCDKTVTRDVDWRPIRTFMLGRLGKPELTDQRFSKPKDFDPDKHLHGGFGVMSGEAQPRMIAPGPAKKRELYP